MGHWSFCDSRIRWRAWLCSASAKEVGCELFVCRFASWRDCYDDPYAWLGRFGYQHFDLDGDSDVVGGGCAFDLVFEPRQKQGLDQLGAIAADATRPNFRNGSVLSEDQTIHALTSVEARTSQPLLHLSSFSFRWQIHKILACGL